MKKTIIAFTIAFVSMSASLFAQQQTNKIAMMQNMKQQLKDSVGLSDAQADSVISIRQQYMPQMKQAMSDTTGNKASEMKTIRDEQKERLSKVLTPDQMTKLDEYMKSMMAGKMKRMNNSSGGNN